MFSELIQGVVELPPSLQLLLLGGVLYVVRLVLGKYLSEEKVAEVAAGVSAALLSLVGAFLGLIPPEFEAVASAALSLLAILLGMVFVARAYVAQRHALFG